MQRGNPSNEWDDDAATLVGDNESIAGERERAGSASTRGQRPIGAQGRSSGQRLAPAQRPTDRQGRSSGQRPTYVRRPTDVPIIAEAERSAEAVWRAEAERIAERERRSEAEWQERQKWHTEELLEATRREVDNEIRIDRLKEQEAEKERRAEDARKKAEEVTARHAAEAAERERESEQAAMGECIYSYNGSGGTGYYVGVGFYTAVEDMKKASPDFQTHFLVIKGKDKSPTPGDIEKYIAEHTSDGAPWVRFGLYKISPRLHAAMQKFQKDVASA